jgi:hypothetical protein
MTWYAIDEQRHDLVATWSTGRGDAAGVIAALPVSASSELLFDLAVALTHLSTALWRCYTHPASAAAGTEPNSEGWRRQRARNAFAKVTASLRAPNLSADGDLIVRYNPVEETGHRVGRALYAIGDPAVTAAVVADVEQEIGAVERAELGDLAGRAAQAVVLTREDAYPVQVAEADRVLAQDPLNGPRLLARFDPTAASVAAAHWLHAAAAVVADRIGTPLVGVVLEADQAQALPCATPTLVLELLETGLRPHRVVTALVGEAMRVADGVAPDSAWRAKEAEAKAVEPAVFGPGGSDDVRLTPLDPRRPAPDLLEDLLRAIHGCWLLFATDHDEDEGQGEGEDGHDVDDDVEELSPGQVQRLDAQVRAVFVQAVRDRAEANRDRLL